jgi:outer membrane protein
MSQEIEEHVVSHQDRTFWLRRGTLTLAAAIILSFAFLAATTNANASDVTIAVVRDGSGPDDRLIGLIEQELTNHTPRGTTVRFKMDEAFDAGWHYAAAPAALRAAFDDQDVDLVLAVGSLTTHAAALSEVALAKPVVSTFAQRADVFKLPYTDDGESLKDNLSFIVIPQRVAADVRAFQELVPFKTLHIAVMAEDLNNLDELAAGLQRYEKDLGLELVIVPITTNVTDSMAQLSGADAVYLTRLQRLTTDQRSELIDQLNGHGIPTFSMLGHTDVELGALAGVSPDIEAQLVRRVALNLGQLLRGRSTTELPVLLSVDTRLRINARTAVAIGYVPQQETRIFAEFVHPEALESDAEPLNFGRLLSMAESGSQSLRVVDSEVEGVRLDMDRAKSSLLPQISANLNYTHADNDMTESEQGSFGSLVLRQQIFDDELKSSYKSSKQRHEGARLIRETERLDVLAAAGQAFYYLALTQAQYRIGAGDLRVTEDNLEMAKLRKDVGYSGRDEVLRWESVLAERRTTLFRAAETAETARIALNQVLGVPQTARWTPAPLAIDPDVFPFFEGRLDGVFDDLGSLEFVRRIIVDIALENAPELQTLDRSIEAQRIGTDQLRRRYFLPRFFAEAEYSEQLTSPEGPILAEDDTFIVSVNAAYPIFEGGRRKADLGRARSDQETLNRQQSLIAELIEQRTRTALRRCENSFPRIKFGMQAADAAGENLELVREQYAEGTVNVTDLLDAQNQKFNADQFSSAAIYEFMGDLVELQRAIAWFELDNTSDQRDAFVERIISATTEG